MGVVGDDEGFGEEVRADGGLLDFFEGVMNEAVEEGGLADALGSEDDDFGCEEVR